jgi:prepilin-type N-terminal cleavage/methylation domain-containing protein
MLGLKTQKSTLAATRATARERGFTLLEMLTAMALFFMVAGLLVSAVTQSIRIAEQGAAQAVAVRDVGMRLAWFREAVGFTVLPPPVKFADPPPLVGSARSVSGLSLALPSTSSRAPAAYTFEIGYDPQSGESQLQLLTTADASATARGLTSTKEAGAIELLRWRGSEGRFAYLDTDLQWRDAWPARASSGATIGLSELPLAVELRYGFPAKSLVVAIQDRAPQPPRMRDLL